MKKIVLIIPVLIAIFAFKPADQSVWTLDKAHAKLGFTVTHLMVSDVEGWFKNFDAKIISTNDDFSDATIEMTAQVNSINTEEEQRDTHLKSADFLDAATYPTISFKSKTFKKVGTNMYKAIGNLTMHGVTKMVSLDAVGKIGVNPNSKKTIVGFKVTGTLKRSDFGIGTKFPDAMVSDEIAIVANAEFVKN